MNPEILKSVEVNSLLDSQGVNVRLENRLREDFQNFCVTTRNPLKITRNCELASFLALDGSWYLLQDPSGHG